MTIEAKALSAKVDRYLKYQRLPLHPDLSTENNKRYCKEKMIEVFDSFTAPEIHELVKRGERNQEWIKGGGNH